MNEKTISLDIIKNNLNDIFRQCQNELFKNYEKVDDYCFYNLIIKNWEKEKPDIEEECYYENISDKEESYLKNLIKDHLNEEMKFQNFLKDSAVCDELKLQFESEDIILC